MAANITPTIFDSEIEQIRHSLIEGYLPALKIEDIIGTATVDPGTIALTRTRVIGMSAPEKLDQASFVPKDDISRTPESIYVEPIGLGFELPQKEIDNARMNGLPIMDMYFQSVGRRMAEAVEDDVLTSYRAVAATQASQQWDSATDGTASEYWGHASASPYDDILEVVEVVESHGSEMPDMFISRELYLYLLRRDAYGNTALSFIEESTDVNIIKSKRLGTGKAVGVNANNCEYLFSKEIDVEAVYKTNGMWDGAVKLEGVADILSYRDVMDVTLKA